MLAIMTKTTQRQVPRPCGGPAKRKEGPQEGPKRTTKPQKTTRNQARKASEGPERSKRRLKKNIKSLYFNGLCKFWASEMAAKSFRNASEILYLASTIRKPTTKRKTHTPNVTNALKDTKHDPKQGPTRALGGPITRQKEPQEAPKRATRAPKRPQNRAPKET